MCNKFFKVLLISMLCALTVVFTACGSGVKPEDLSIYPVPSENKLAWQSNYGGSNASDKDGTYTAGYSTRIVVYNDAATGKHTIPCDISGCKHNDETCKAWIGPVAEYLEYNGQFIAVLEYENEKIELVAKDLSGEKPEILNTWEYENNKFYEISLISASDNTILFEKKESDYSGNKVTENVTIMLYDMDSGKMREVFTVDNDYSMSYLAQSKDYLAAMYYPADTKMCELRLYDLNSGEYKVIADKEHDNIDFIYTNIAYGYKVVYRCSDEFSVLDTSTGETKEVLTAENVDMYWTADNKIFLVTDTDTKNCRVSCVDIDGGEPVRIGGQETANISICAETDNYFRGVNGPNRIIISKKDYYTGKLENKRPF